MTIKDKGNYAVITISLGYTEDGKQIRKTTSYTPKTSKRSPVKRRKEIEAYANEFEQKVKNGQYYDGENMTFSEFVKKWKSDYAVEHLSEAVLETYEDILKNRVLPAIGSLKINKITPIHLQDIYKKMTDKGLAPATVHRCNAVISGIFTRAYKWGLVKENPCSRCDLPKLDSDAEKEVFSAEQADRFLDALKLEYHLTAGGHKRTDDTGKPYNVSDYERAYCIPYQFQVFYTISIYSGARRGEMVALKWGDIDKDAKTITIRRAASKTKAKGVILKSPKTKAGYRTITLPKICFDMLQKLSVEQSKYAISLGDAWKGKRGSERTEQFVFIQDDGTMMYLDTPSAEFKKILKRYNAEYAETEEEKFPNLRLHDLRHTNATLLIGGHVPVTTVSKRLGHSRTSVTLDVYAHALREQDENASEVLDDLLTRKKKEA